eukprot:121747-Amphidinium_carterae.2
MSVTCGELSEETLSAAIYVFCGGRVGCFLGVNTASCYELMIHKLVCDTNSMPRIAAGPSIAL